MHAPEPQDAKSSEDFILINEGTRQWLRASRPSFDQGNDASAGRHGAA
jgi:hypothetical protein